MGTTKLIIFVLTVYLSVQVHGDKNIIEDVKANMNMTVVVKNETMTIGDMIESHNETTMKTDSSDDKQCYQCVYGLPGHMNKSCLSPTPSTVQTASCGQNMSCATVMHHRPEGLLLIRSCGVPSTPELCGNIGSATHEDLNLHHLGNVSSTLKELLAIASGNSTENETCPKVCYCNGDKCNDKMEDDVNKVYTRIQSGPNAVARTDMLAAEDEPRPAVDKDQLGRPVAGDHDHDGHYSGGYKGGAESVTLHAFVGVIFMSFSFVM